MLALPGMILAGTVPAALYSASNGSGWQELEGVRLGATGGSFPRVPSWERAPAFSPRTMKRRAVFMLQSRSEGCSLATMRAGMDSATKGLDDPDVHQILPSAKTKGLVVAACGEGAYRSTDRGEHWENITPPGNRTFGSAVAEDGSGTIYLAMALGRPTLAAQRARRRRAFVSKTEHTGIWPLKDCRAVSWPCASVSAVKVSSPRHRKVRFCTSTHPRAQSSADSRRLRLLPWVRETFTCARFPKESCSIVRWSPRNRRSLNPARGTSA